MKKFLLIMTVAAVLLFTSYILVYYQGFYVDFHPEQEVSAAIKTQGKEIVVRTDNGFQPLTIKGVDLPSSIPGHYATDFAAGSKTYLKWFQEIKELGANTIRVYTLMEDTFYNAFYEFNNTQEEPLYLLQGLWVTDYAQNSSTDAYSKEFYTRLKKDAMDAVDIIHGKKNIIVNQTRGSGSYRKDISSWVLGYVLGLEWGTGTMAYTDHKEERRAGFDGDYVTAGADATSFETMLARVMDQILSYESSKYKEQRLVSFINSPVSDPFVYEPSYGRQIAKYITLDAEHLEMKSTVKSGYFASYRVYEFFPGYAEYFSQEQKDRLKDLLPDIDKTLYYEGYTQLLNQYHSMPVVITGYGFSTARGIESTLFGGDKKGPLTEQEQGEALVKTYRDIIASGCAGAVITSWQDVWGNRTWNTSYAVNVTTAQQWSDIQTNGQGYGLLALEPGQKESICYVDGDFKEWENKEAVAKTEEATLFTAYDERYLYFFVQKEGISQDTPLYIPIDTTPKSGAFTAKSMGLSFQRAVDFLICLQGADNSSMLVQERYEALRENYLMETARIDPFVRYPDKDSPQFVPINMILQKTTVLNAEDEPEVILQKQMADTFETGKLTIGNANPDSAYYNSLADVCYGTDGVEVRIPWQMLNFSDPSRMLIHDDYYEHYGVEDIAIKELYVGISLPETGDAVTMQQLELEGWADDVKWHERLKQSYGILQKEWSNHAD